MRTAVPLGIKTGHPDVVADCKVLGAALLYRAFPFVHDAVMSFLDVQSRYGLSFPVVQ